MAAYTDKKGRGWELTPIPVQSAFVGGQLVGYLCWVKSTAANQTHPGDYARTAFPPMGQVIVATATADAVLAGQQYAEIHP